MKIYINNNNLILTDVLSDTKIIKYQDFNQLKQIISDLESNKFNEIKLYASNINDILTDLYKIYTKIDAAGGIIRNEKNEILIINRLNKFDLPKGKVEPNEDIKDTAIREVKEETGLQDVGIISFFDSTFHTYELKNKKILKQTHWFLMRSTSTQKLIPQTIEDISSVEWINALDINKIFKNTYPSIIDLINKLAIIRANPKTL